MPTGTIGIVAAPVAPTPPPADHPAKLAAPFPPLVGEVTNYVQAQGMSSTQWTSVAGFYRELHYEGHHWARLRDNDLNFQPAKFKTGGGGRVNAYVQGSSVTQGSPWTPWYVAAHHERHYPLSVARIRPVAGLTLATGINNVITTIAITLPTTPPAGLPATHPNGTPAALWPIIGSTVTPTTTTYSQNTASYVSTLRTTDSEVIGLPVYSAGAYTVTGGVLTITGCVRGMWGTTALGKSAGAQFYVPDYVGSASADPNDSGLSGNPVNNSAANPIRYMTATWDSARGALHDGVAAISDVIRAELLGLELALPKTITAVDTTANTLTSTAHGLVNADRVMLGGYDIPTGIRSLTPYYVVGAAANTFQVALTVGGAAIALVSAGVGGLKVAKCRSTEAAPIFDTVWLDITSGSVYNQADGWGRDIDGDPALTKLPRDYTAGVDTTPWIDRENAKRAQLNSQLTTTYGFPALTYYANSYIAQQSSDVLPRTGWVADAVWDGYALEHFGQMSARFAFELDQLCRCMAGTDENGTVTSATGHKAVCWIKTNEFIVGSVDSSATKDRYIRRGYGLWLLAWRSSATSMKLQIKAYTSSLSERPSDTVGREIMFWDLGVPSTQLGGKPTNPATVADIYQPVAGLYRRDYAGGVVLVNTTAAALSITADRAYYNATTETGGGGRLAAVSAGATVTVAAYDSVLLLSPTGGAPVLSGTNIQYAEGTWLLYQPTSLADITGKSTTFQGYLSQPGIAGLSLRIPATLLYPNAVSQLWDPAVPNAGLAIAQAAGRKFDIRPMAGRYTPSWALGRSYPVVSGGVTWQIPAPFQASADGLATTRGVVGNPAFEAWYQQMCADAAAWCRANGIRLLHLPWYGRLWNEYNNGSDVQNLAGYGPDNFNFQESHRRLIDYGLAITGPDLMIELPQSGHPNAGAGTPAANIYQVFNYGAGIVGNYSDRGPASTANGWGGANISIPVGSVPGGSGTDARGSATVAFFYQAWANRLQYNDYTYDGVPATPTKTMYSFARNNHARRAEFYPDAFQYALVPSPVPAEAELFNAAVAFQAWLLANPTLIA